jgi:hypothetical protein
MNGEVVRTPQFVVSIAEIFSPQQSGDKTVYRKFATAHLGGMLVWKQELDPMDGLEAAECAFAQAVRELFGTVNL